MTEHEIFEKLKEALDYHYMYDSLECGEERKEVDNLEDYLRIIKQEREIEKDFKDAELKGLNTYKEFIHYLHDKDIGNIDRVLLSALKTIVLILSLDTSPSQKC